MSAAVVLFDTHCHLDTSAFDADRDAVLARAHEAGVAHFVNPAYDLESSRRAVALAQARDDVFAAVGVHPNEVGSFNEAALETLHALARAPRVVAIGEIGLDYHWDKTTPQQQAAAFIAQLDLARRLSLPVIVHCREAYDDCLALLASHGRDLPLVMHAFSSELSHVRRALDLGYSIGIGGPVTYPKAHGLREVAAYVPADRLLIETDAPYLPPQGKRGQRNEPAYLTLIARAIAEVRRVSLEELAAQTTHNACALFRLPS
ncbi:MAG: TatD family hydrolase [Thermoflexales bacterium]|nr:TatD family hydrolase [Thermoflexales bacterium]